MIRGERLRWVGGKSGKLPLAVFIAAKIPSNGIRPFRAKTRELIAFAVAVTLRCDGCITVHIEAAINNGATNEEIAEALGVATTANAGAALVYSARVMDAFKEYPACRCVVSGPAPTTCTASINVRPAAKLGHVVVRRFNMRHAA
jgi:AhpD family alkylhydroperoxidase